MTEIRCGSVRELAAIVERVAPRDPVAWEGRPLVRGRQVSKSRADQLRATLGHLDRALAVGGFPRGAGARVSVLLSTRGVDRVLELGGDEAGLLRDPRHGATGAFSWAQLAVLRDCLGLLAELAGVAEGLVLPRVFRERQHLREVPSRAQTTVLYRRMADQAANVPLGDLAVRALAVVGIVLDAGVRSGELAAMRVDEVGPGEESVVVVRRAQNATHLPTPGPEVVRLRAGSRVALRRWLRLRAQVVGALEGSAPAELWVSLRPAAVPQPDGSRVMRPPGMPLSAQSLARGHCGGMETVNSVMAGRWIADREAPEGGGPWVPLPTTLEQLRRAVGTPQERRERSRLARAVRAARVG